MPYFYWQRGAIGEKLDEHAESGEEHRVLVERVNVDYILAMQANPLPQMRRMKLAGAATRLAQLGYGGKEDEALEMYEDLVHTHRTLEDSRICSSSPTWKPNDREDAIAVLDGLLSLE